MKIKLKEGSDHSPGNDTARTYEPAPDGSVFEAKVVSVEHRESFFKTDEGEVKMEFNFKFEVCDGGDFDGRWFWGSTTTFFSNHSSNRLYSWVKSIEDKILLPVDYELDTEELADKRCVIAVGAKPKAFKEDGSHLNADGSPKITNRVIDVGPSRAARVDEAVVPNVDDPF